MHDRVEAAKLLHRHVSEIALDRRDRPWRRAQVAAGEEPAVEPDDVVPGVRQVGRKDRADVAAVAGDKDAHGLH